jgi:hypothetical protein
MPDSPEIVKGDIYLIKQLARKWIFDNCVEVHVLRVFRDIPKVPTGQNDGLRPIVSSLLRLKKRLDLKFGPTKGITFELEFDYAFIKSTNREALSIAATYLTKKGFEIYSGI